MLVTGINLLLQSGYALPANEDKNGKTGENQYDPDFPVANPVNPSRKGISMQQCLEKWCTKYDTIQPGSIDKLNTKANARV